MDKFLQDMMRGKLAKLIETCRNTASCYLEQSGCVKISDKLELAYQKSPEQFELYFVNGVRVFRAAEMPRGLSNTLEVAGKNYSVGLWLHDHAWENALIKARLGYSRAAAVA